MKSWFENGWKLLKHLWNCIIWTLLWEIKVGPLSIYLLSSLTCEFICTLLYFVDGKVVIKAFLPDLLKIVMVVLMFVFVSVKGTPFKTSLTPRIITQTWCKMFNISRRYSLFHDTCSGSTICYIFTEIRIRFTGFFF